MPVDPNNPDTFEEEDDDRADRAELSYETPEADAAEQRADLRQDRDEPPTRVDPDAANEADAVEQGRAVVLDEDDYR